MHSARPHFIDVREREVEGGRGGERGRRNWVGDTCTKMED